MPKQRRPVRHHVVGLAAERHLDVGRRPVAVVERLPGARLIAGERRLRNTLRSEKSAVPIRKRRRATRHRQPARGPEADRTAAAPVACDGMHAEEQVSVAREAQHLQNPAGETALDEHERAADAHIQLLRPRSRRAVRPRDRRAWLERAAPRDGVTELVDQAEH